MTVTYMISFIDKVALGDASIFGIEEYDASITYENRGEY
jgi:hypothetical protein